MDEEEVDTRHSHPTEVLNQGSLNDLVDAVPTVSHSIEGPGILSRWRTFLHCLLFLAIAYFVGKNNLSVLYVAVLGLLWIVYHSNTVRPLENHRRLALEKAFSKPKMLLQCLETAKFDIPKWLCSDEERVDWLNKILVQMWPTLSEALAESIRYNMTESLETVGIELGELDLGSEPFFIPSIKVHSKNKLVVDMDVKFAPRGSTCELSVTLAGADVRAHLDNIYISTRIRLILSPLCVEWPCFSAISFSLLEKPVIEFNVKAMLVEITALPGLQQYLQDMLSETICLWYVWPNQYVIPMFDTPDIVNSSTVRAKAIGVVRVLVVEAENLSAPKQVKPLLHPTCTVSIGNIEKKTTKSHKVGHAEWNQQFEFEVFDLDVELKFVVTDLGLLKLFRFSTLGKASVPLRKVINKQGKEQVLQLEGGETGEIAFCITYLPFESSNHSMSIHSPRDSIGRHSQTDFETSNLNNGTIPEYDEDSKSDDENDGFNIKTMLKRNTSRANMSTIPADLLEIDILRVELENKDKEKDIYIRFKLVNSGLRGNTHIIKKCSEGTWHRICIQIPPNASKTPEVLRICVMGARFPAFKFDQELGEVSLVIEDLHIDSRESITLPLFQKQNPGRQKMPNRRRSGTKNQSTLFPGTATIKYTFRRESAKSVPIFDMTKNTRPLLNKLSKFSANEESSLVLFNLLKAPNTLAKLYIHTGKVYTEGKPGLVRKRLYLKFTLLGDEKVTTSVKAEDDIALFDDVVSFDVDSGNGYLITELYHKRAVGHPALLGKLDIPVTELAKVSNVTKFNFQNSDWVCELQFKIRYFTPESNISESDSRGIPDPAEVLQ